MKLLVALVGMTVATAAAAQDMAPVAPAAPIAAPATPPKSEMICRTELETGSLVKRHKTCLTKKQWAYVNDQHENYARKLVEDGTGKVNGN